MKFLILTSLFLLASCSSWYKDSKREKCIQPENPYSAGGHYEGFQWAESRWVMSCNGNSSSFNNGCEEYGRQLETYNQCIR